LKGLSAPRYDPLLLGDDIGGRSAEGVAAYGRPAFPGRVLLLLGGVNGRNPPRFPFCIEEEELGLLGTCILPEAGRVLLLFGGVNGRNPPRFCAAVDWLPWVRVMGRSNPPAEGGRLAAAGRLPAGGRLPPAGLLAALRVAGLFISRDAGVPALGFCMVPLAATPVLAPTGPPACTGVMWFRCMACCNWAVCRSNDAGRDAARPLPKKRCAVPCTVAGAAARPLADKLARDGTTGRLPVIMRALCN
jgi:hypothetical protein